MSSTSSLPADKTKVAGNPYVMLALATIGFAVNFWAWALLSPLGPLFRTTGTLGKLSESDVALLVAVPVLVGSLGRIPVGALTDKFGGRIMFPLLSMATIVPVVFIGFFGLDSYGALLFGGFFLGVAGTVFAVGGRRAQGAGETSVRRESLGAALIHGYAMTLVSDRVPLGHASNGTIIQK